MSWRTLQLLPKARSSLSCLASCRIRSWRCSVSQQREYWRRLRARTFWTIAAEILARRHADCYAWQKRLRQMPSMDVAQASAAGSAALQALVNLSAIPAVRDE